MSLCMVLQSYIATGEVASLKHELRNDSVESAALVAEALLASAESTEVLDGLGNYIIVEVEVDATLLGCGKYCQRPSAQRGLRP